MDPAMDLVMYPVMVPVMVPVTDPLVDVTIYLQIFSTDLPIQKHALKSFPPPSPYNPHPCSGSYVVPSPA